MEATLAQVAATAMVNLSFAWTVGVLACRLWLIGQTAAWQQAVVRRLAPAMLAGLACCAAAIFLSLWTEAAIMGDVAWPDAWPVCVQMMATTHYGHAGRHGHGPAGRRDGGASASIPLQRGHAPCGRHGRLVDAGGSGQGDDRPCVRAWSFECRRCGAVGSPSVHGAMGRHRFRRWLAGASPGCG